jgi:hypothetical protein
VRIAIWVAAIALLCPACTRSANPVPPSPPCSWVCEDALLYEARGAVSVVGHDPDCFDATTSAGGFRFTPSKCDGEYALWVGNGPTRNVFWELDQGATDYQMSVLQAAYAAVLREGQNVKGFSALPMEALHIHVAEYSNELSMEIFPKHDPSGQRAVLDTSAFVQVRKDDLQVTSIVFPPRIARRWQPAPSTSDSPPSP